MYFIEQEKEHDYKLRQVVRLLKMFSKSRDSWKNMPGGLIQSVLADEQFQKYDRIDERFYYTIKAIKERLFVNKDVYNPTDKTKSLKLVSKDNAKMENLYKRLNYEISELDILFDDNCTYNQAVEAWGEFFNHTYWEGQKKEGNSALSKSYASLQESEEFFEYKETEEFIHNFFPVNIQYTINLNCEVKQKQRASGWLLTMISKGQHLRVECELNFVASVNIPKPYDVYWKVKNGGELAKKGDSVRGDIVKTNSLTHFEVTSFAGEHYVECYIVKSGVCVARERIPVTIIT